MWKGVQTNNFSHFLSIFLEYVNIVCLISDISRDIIAWMTELSLKNTWSLIDISIMNSNKIRKIFRTRNFENLCMNNCNLWCRIIWNILKISDNWFQSSFSGVFSKSFISYTNDNIFSKLDGDLRLFNHLSFALAKDLTVGVFGENEAERNKAKRNYRHVKNSARAWCHTLISFSSKVNWNALNEWLEHQSGLLKICFRRSHSGFQQLKRPFREYSGINTGL